MSAAPDPDDAVRAWAQAHAATVSTRPRVARAARSVADLAPRLLHTFKAARGEEDSDSDLGVRGLAVLRSADVGVAILTGCRDGTVRMWDPLTGHERHDFSLDESRVDAVAAITTADGRSLVALGDRQGRVRLLDPATGAPLRTIDAHEDEVTGVQFAVASDGTLLLATVSDDGYAKLWDAATATLVRSLQASSGDLSGLDVNVAADGTVLLAVGSSRQAQVWDASADQQRCEIEVDASGIVRFIIAGDGVLRLVTGGRDPDLLISNPQTGERLQRFVSGGFVTGADCPRNRRNPSFLAALGDNGRIDLIDPITAEPIRHVDGPTEAYWSARLAEFDDGRLLLAAGRIDGSVDVWSLLEPAEQDAGTDRQLEVLRQFSLPDHVDGETQTVFLHGRDDALLLATGTPDAVRIWDLDGGTRLLRTLTPGGWFLGVSATPLPDGSDAVIVSENERAVYLGNPATGEYLHRVGPEGVSLTGYSASFVTETDGADSLYVTTSSGVSRWRIADSGADPELDPHVEFSGDGTVFSIAAGRLGDGSSVLAVGGRHAVVLYGLPTGEELQRFEASNVSSVALCELRDGTSLLGVFDVDGISVWNVERGTRARIAFESPPKGAIRLAALPDGGALLLTGPVGEALLYDAITGDRLFALGATSWQRYNSMEPFGLSARRDGTIWASHPRGEDVVVTVLAGPTAGSTPGDGGGRRRGRDREVVAQRFALLAGAGLDAAFGLVEDLAHLIGAGEGSGALEGLVGHPGFRRLRALDWPLAARVGLAALLLEEAPSSVRPAPPGADLSRLRSELLAALERPPAGARPAPVPIADLIAGAQAVTDRTLTLLTLLGPEAVAADPMMPLRLRRQADNLPEIGFVAPTAITDLPRRVEAELDAHAVSARAGSATVGLRRHGPQRDLLRSQLALPPRLYAWLQARGGLLYRLHEGEPQIFVEPLVIVLDTTPPTFGPVEATLRLLAFGLAGAVLRARQEVAMVTLDRPGRLAPLRGAEDLVGLWTTRCYDPPDLREALVTAGSAGLAATVVLTTHHVARHHRLTPCRSLRVATTHAPGERPRPAMSGPFGVHLAPRAAVPDVARAIAELLIAGTGDGER
ncbi:WD40 repeat domain-containing protein [Dactylosporangium sp. NPDC000244]|uniref:WD40 repeat domain-containing protein n=1 Tax=Dactylosporangium sp. NPDC000244 TaxID=3154365 RepID=UPI003332EC63